MRSMSFEVRKQVVEVLSQAVLETGNIDNIFITPIYETNISGPKTVGVILRSGSERHYISHDPDYATRAAARDTRVQY